MREPEGGFIMVNDGWIFNSHIWAAMKQYAVYTRGNDIEIRDSAGKVKYTGVYPDILVRDRYRYIIQMLKEK